MKKKMQVHSEMKVHSVGEMSMKKVHDVCQDSQFFIFKENSAEIPNTINERDRISGGIPVEEKCVGMP